jgi:predicted TIM-barrel fold metal-dependent hydrolase
MEAAALPVLLAQPAKRGKIDVHHHVGPPPSSSGGNGGGPPWSPEIAIEEMDRNGVAAGIGFPGPIAVSADLGRGRKQAREYNEYGALIGKDHPGRFGLFAALPMHDIDGSLKEIEYALDVLKADGFGISTSYGDLWLGDAKFQPVFEELNRRKAVVYVHPNDAPCCTPATMTYEKQGISGPWIEWPMNTARTIFSFLLSGNTRQFPEIRMIFSHSGGVMPLLISRIAGFKDWSAVGLEKLKELFPEGIEAEFRKLYFEGAQGFDPVNFAALRALVPLSHILFGTDYNRFPISHTVKAFENLRLPSDSRRAIERENAVKLLPRWSNRKTL